MPRPVSGLFFKKLTARFHVLRGGVAGDGAIAAGRSDLAQEFHDNVAGSEDAGTAMN